MRGEVMQKAESLARDAANAAKKGRNPFTVTDHPWVGEMTARSLVVGLENETKRTLDAARALGRNFGTVMSGAIAPAVNAGGIADAAMAAYDAEKKLQETSNKTNKKGKATGAAKAAKKTLAKCSATRNGYRSLAGSTRSWAVRLVKPLSAAGSAIKDSAVYKKAQDAPVVHSATQRLDHGLRRDLETGPVSVLRGVEGVAGSREVGARMDHKAGGGAGN